ncbi:hypothetical protein BESB_067550 [Besnoitia besnoiti]|uniref:Uncharacterized protein n=1 Tax=Besnoitia besnoiti TaxID=94643 RepID=A0A2A9MH42_BESBE|nr:hypothetical protein BESB_067550 [Besnoitia besnoiti]PFH34722.1 hypothetical protein BESB_067550 [Besnoitia besnoiti]
MERLGMLLHTAAVKVRETFSAAGTSSRSESSGTEGGRSSLGLLPHQLLSVSDLLVAATNLFALRITAGTLTDRINLQLQREAASRTSQNSELASHWQAADPGSTALPTESQDADQSVYRRAVALGDTGGLEIFVVCIWTLILLVALKAGFVLACLSSTSRSPGGCVLAAPVLQDMLLTRHQENDDSDWEDYEIEESVGVASPVPVMRGVNKAGSGVSEDGRDPGTSIRRRGKKGADGSDGL